MPLIIIDEWKNFLARINHDETAQDSELFDSASDALALRFWASYRGQTLARTGMYILPFLYSFPSIEFLHTTKWCMPFGFPISVFSFLHVFIISYINCLFQCMH